jgi:hypothetical protein
LDARACALAPHLENAPGTVAIFEIGRTAATRAVTRLRDAEQVSVLSLLSNAVLVWNTARIAEIVRDLVRSVDRPVRLRCWRGCPRCGAVA